MGAVCGSNQCRASLLENELDRHLHCIICNLGIQATNPGAICSAPNCRWLYDEEVRKQGLHQQKIEQDKHDEAAMQALRARLELVVDELAPGLGCDDRLSLPLLIVPTNDRQLVAQADERRVALREHLLRVLDESAPEQPPHEDSGEGLGTQLDVLPGPDADASTGHSFAPELAPLIEGICATCRGGCCLGGANKAYLTTETLARYRSSQPGMSRDEVIDAYLARIPQSSYEDSCVYHSDSGCGLSEEMRSDTCNRYFCRSLLHSSVLAKESQEQSDPVLATFVVSAKEHRIVRAALVKRNMVRPIDDLSAKT